MTPADPLDDALSAGSIHPQERRNPTPANMFEDARKASAADLAAHGVQSAVNAQAHRLGIPASEDIKLTCSFCNSTITHHPSGQYLQLQGNPSCPHCSSSVLDAEAVLKTGNLFKIPDHAIASFLFSTPTTPTDEELWRLLVSDANRSMPESDRVAALSLHLTMASAGAVLLAPGALASDNGGSNDDADDDDEGEEWKHPH